MNGATEVASSMPPALPQAAMAPCIFVTERRLANAADRVDAAGEALWPRSLACC